MLGRAPSGGAFGTLGHWMLRKDPKGPSTVCHRFDTGPRGPSVYIDTYIYTYIYIFTYIRMHISIYTCIYGRFYNSGLPFVGVLVIRAPLFSVYVGRLMLGNLRTTYRTCLNLDPLDGVRVATKRLSVGMGAVQKLALVFQCTQRRFQHSLGSAFIQGIRT